MLVKRLFGLLLFMGILAAVHAVPAYRVRRALQLTDGTSVMATLRGGSDFHSYVTDDGYVLEQVCANPDLYALTTRRFADASEAVSGVRRQARRRIGSQATAPLPATGSPKVPVVLVNFTDSVFTVGETDDEVRRYFDLYCNGTPGGDFYTGHGSYGSIRDYFASQSDGQFTPEFVVIGPVTVAHPTAYYGQNTGQAGTDIRYDRFCTDAIQEATKVFDGDWMQFDNRGKGQVDLIFFIFAGCGENYGAASTTLWPKEKVNTQTYNNIKFATSACCCAGRPIFDGSVIREVRTSGIGVMCHELSHALGLPDFYNKDYASFGMDIWSIMDYGCYAQSGYIPTGYTAYERDFMGWRRLETLTDDGPLTLAPTEAGGKGYKVVNDENPNEYYILENRGNEGWDTGLFRVAMPGLQVTHVDYVASRWNSNNVNTFNASTGHQLMTIIGANNLYKGTYNEEFTSAEVVETWRGNLYPYVYTAADGTTQCNDSLTSHSVPAATVYTASGFMNKNIYDIRRLDDGDISLYFGRQRPVGVAAPAVAGGAADALLYDLSGRRVSASEAARPGLYLTRRGRKVVVR